MTSPSRGRARIGVFVPFTNTNLEPDMVMRLMPAFAGDNPSRRMAFKCRASGWESCRRARSAAG